MAEQTNDLKLFKYNTATDGKEVFSIEKSMNENWDKIDAFSSAIKSLSNLDEVGEKRFTDINTALSKKLEAEVLLAENGYIKFNNNILINWFSHVGSTSSQTAIKCTVTMPHAYEKFYVVHKAIDKDMTSSDALSWRAYAVNSLSLTQITYKSFYAHNNTFITIGY